MTTTYQPTVQVEQTTETKSEYILAAIPWEVAQQLTEIAKMHTGENIIVCQAPYYWQGKRVGSVWAKVEKCDRRTDRVTVEALRTSEHGTWHKHTTSDGFPVRTDTMAFPRDLLAHFTEIGEGFAAYLVAEGESEVIYDAKPPVMERAEARQFVKMGSV